MKEEISSFLRAISYEYCMYGFMISADLDRNFAVDQEEWFEAFKLFGKTRLFASFGKHFRSSGFGTSISR